MVRWREQVARSDRQTPCLSCTKVRARVCCNSPYSYLEALEQVVAEKQKVAASLSRSDALAMELQARLEEKEARGKTAFPPVPRATAAICAHL